MQASCRNCSLKKTGALMRVCNALRDAAPNRLKKQPPRQEHEPVLNPRLDTSQPHRASSKTKLEHEPADNARCNETKRKSWTFPQGRHAPSSGLLRPEAARRHIQVIGKNSGKCSQATNHASGVGNLPLCLRCCSSRPFGIRSPSANHSSIALCDGHCSTRLQNVHPCRRQ